MRYLHGGFAQTLLAALVACLMSPSGLHSQLPPGFARTTAVTGFRATSLTFAPDGRLFLTRKTGTIHIFSGGALLPAPYATLNVSSENERGLLGLAFDPGFASNCYLYVYYITGPLSPEYSGLPTPRVSRLRGCGNTATGAERIVREFPSASGSSHHNGGDIHFGPDGKLYIGIGDGTLKDLAQDRSSYRGKMLRINKNGSVPADNPFVGRPGVLPEIWALGFRNPWRYTWRPENDALIIADVGTAHWEELDLGVAGGNYAWARYEGPCKVNVPSAGEADCIPDPTVYPARFEYPIYYLPHAGVNSSSIGRRDAVGGDHVGEGNRAIIGGVILKGGNYPGKYKGRYFYGDYVTHEVRSIRFDLANQVVLDELFDTLPGPPTCFAVGPDGTIYVADYGMGGREKTGRVFRYVFTSP